MDSVITFAVYGRRARSSIEGARPTSTSSSSACSFASAAGFCASSHHVHESELAVVSCPARKSVIASSRSCWSVMRSEEHTSELQSRLHLVCRLLLEKKKQ